MTRVVVADDHSVIRHGIKQILDMEEDLEVVAEASTVPELMDILHRTPTDVLVLDLSMPGGGGLDAIVQLKKQKPGLPILVLSVHPEGQYAVRAIRSGAMGYLSKECAPEELVKALRLLVSGHRYLTAAVGDLLATAVNDQNSKVPHATLSDREFQVMIMIAQGRGLTEIAKSFNLSVKTIATYRERMLKKMSMETNAELIQYVVKNNLLTDS